MSRIFIPGLSGNASSLSCSSPTHKACSHRSDCRSFFSRATSDMFSHPAALANITVSRNEQPKPTCKSKPRSNWSTESKPRTRVTALVLRANCSQSAGSSFSRNCQFSSASVVAILTSLPKAKQECQFLKLALMGQGPLQALTCDGEWGIDRCHYRRHHLEHLRRA